MPATNEKIGWFDILMDNLMLMRMLKGIGSLLDNISDLLRRKGPLRVVLQPFSKRSILPKRHHHIHQWNAFNSHLIRIVKRQDMGMIELSNGTRFTQEQANAFARGLRISKISLIAMNNFDGDLPMKKLIFGQIYLTHATTLQKIDETIMTQLLSFW